MKENEKNVINHVVTIDNRKKIMITSIVEVISATNKTVIAKTQQKTLYINGSNLRVEKLNPEESLLIVSGEIDELKYLNKSPSKSFFKRIFS